MASTFGEVVVVNPASNNTTESRLMRTKFAPTRAVPTQ
jgi:hypothetical protein